MSKVTEYIETLNLLEANQAELAEQIAYTRELITDELRREGLKQVKTATETVSIAKRVSYQVNEVTWQGWAKQQPDVDLDMFYTKALDKKLVTGHAEKVLKETGEVVPGITPVETEYLSIRKAKAEKE